MSIAPLRHTPIRRKLLTLALAAGLAFFTVSALYVLSWRDLEKVSARVSSTYIPTLRDGAAALVSVSALGTELFRYVNQIEPSAYRVADALEGARVALQRIAGSDIPPEIRANIESLLPQVAAQEAGLRRLTARVERDDVLGIGEEHTRMAAEAGVMLRGVERVHGQLLDSIVQENRTGQETSLQRAAMAAALSLLCILAALFYMGMVRRDLESGLAQLREAARRYANGESDSITPLDRGDEVGQLSRFLGQLSTQVKEIEAQLRQQLKFINDVFDSVPLSLAFRDTDGRFRMVNRTWERYFGYTRTQVQGRTFREMADTAGVDRSLAEPISAEDRRALALGPGRSTEPRDVVFRNRHYLQTRTAMADAQGQLIGVLVTGQDQTERLETERELEEQRRRLELVVRASRAGIVDWDGVTRKGWFSDHFKELLGFAGDTDTSSWTFFDRVHPADREWVRASLIEHLKGQDPATRESLMREFRMLRADGSTVWVQTMGLSLRDDSGRTARFLSAVTDISARRAQEAALREQMELTRDLIRALPNPLFLKDAEFRFVHVNPGWEKMSGIPAQKAVGGLVHEVYPPQFAEEFARQDAELLAAPSGTHSMEITIPGRKKTRHYILSKALLRRDDGTLRGMVGSCTEITDLKRIEIELRASREEALQAAQAKAAFLAAMSHEIRTPLNGVLGMAGLLADTGLTEEQREYVDTIRVSGDALLSVINDVLDYSKIESGRMEVENEPFEPMRAVEEALEILGERARGKRLELAAEAEDSVPAWVRGDFGRLRQVLVNLVGNAVKFTERGEVVVRVRAPRAGVLEIEVSDTGIGILKDRLAALFQPFAQADASTTRKYGGTGLGLAISKRLVELMGGELRADSEPGRGSMFIFSVSVSACEAPAATAIAAQPVELAGRRILIVDDNATNLRILRRQLERWGAVPVAASGGQAALALLEGKERFDAALLDYHMPDMDGVMLARRIKTQANSLPLVLLSSSMYRRAEEAEAGLFVVQLLKPVRQQQLREALVTALGGAAPARKGRGSRAGAGGQVQTPLRVLVVDDVDANCRLAQALLRKFGHASEVATSGLEAVEMAIAYRYDVILMDVQMPDIDGMEATRRIHERLGAASPRIIAMTANALPGDREHCIAAGMDDYMSKPIQPQALRAAIEQAGGSAARPVARTAGRTTASAPAGAIDWRRIESLAPFDPDGSMVAGAIASFLADAPGRIEAIRAAHAAADAAGLGATAHALKGAAANIGAAGVEKLSQRIEALARQGDLAGARKAIAGLSKALAQGGAALKTYARRASRGS